MQIDSLTAFDIGVLIVIGLSTLLAFGRGFTTVALSFAAWAGALAAVILGYEYAQPYGREYVSPQELADIITMAAVFFVTLFVLKMLANFIGGIMKSGPLGFLDRSLGALFGLLRGIVVVSALYLAFTRLFPGTDQPEWMSNAQLRPLVAWGAEMLEGLSDEAQGKDPKTVGAEYINKARDSIKSGFIDDGLEKLAPVYKNAQKKALEMKIDDLIEEAEKKLPKKPKKEDDGT